jgi:hypothetical protein
MENQEDDDDANKLANVEKRMFHREGMR